MAARLCSGQKPAVGPGVPLGRFRITEGVMVQHWRQLAGNFAQPRGNRTRLPWLMLVAAVLSLSCSHAVDHVLQHLTVTVYSITVQLEHPHPPYLLLAMTIDNVNPGWVEVEHIDYVAHIDGREVYRGRLRGTDQQLRVDARGRTAVRVQVPLTPGLLLEYRPWSAALVQVEGVYGELADDTAALRLYGLRSRAMARLQWAITRRFDLDLAAGWAHHAVAATGEFVGQGVSGQGHLAYAISLLNPLLRVRVGANGGHNWLAPEIPAGLAARLRTGATMAAVLPDKFFTAGAGATIAQVLLGGWNRPGTQLRCQLDAWVGYWWPENLLTYRLEAGLVWRFLARHQLLVGFSYGNQQGATAGQPSAAVGLKYEYRFAK